MDARHFDRLTRALTEAGTRRALLGLLATLPVLGGLAALRDEDAAGKSRRKRRKKAHNLRRRRRKNRERPCYPGTSCQPGAGNDNAGCDFDHSLAFFELDVQGADLRHANFTAAEMAGANLSGANLEGACLVGANLLGAAVDETTNLDRAIYCRTLMPDGSFNDQDCGEGSRCCPAPVGCQGEQCPAACIDAPNAQCSPNVPYGGCCPGLHCVPSSTAPTRYTCQAPCHEDGVCHRFGAAWHCASEPQICRYLGGECCQHI